MAHGGKGTSICLVGRFQRRAPAGVISSASADFTPFANRACSPNPHDGGSILYVGAKRFHQAADGIQFADASRLRETASPAVTSVAAVGPAFVAPAGGYGAVNPLAKE